MLESNVRIAWLIGLSRVFMQYVGLFKCDCNSYGRLMFFCLADKPTVV